MAKKIGAVLLAGSTIAAAIGGWIWVKDWLFLPPNANLSVNGNSGDEVNVLEGKDFRIEFYVTNENHKGGNWIRAKAAAAEPLDNSPANGLTDVKIEGGDAPTLEGGDPKSLPLHGKAVKAGRYKVGVEADCMAGIWYGYVTLKPCFVTLRAWEPYSIRFIKLNSDGARADLSFELRIGDTFPQGLNIEARLADPGDLNFQFAEIAGKRGTSLAPIEGGVGDKRRVLLRFPVQGLNAMRAYTYVVHMISKTPRSEDKWNETAKELSKPENLTINELN